jgi:hypothetical protein
MFWRDPGIVEGTSSIWSVYTDVIGRLDPKSGKMAEFPSPYGERGTRDMFEDSTGRIWYGGSRTSRPAMCGCARRRNAPRCWGNRARLWDRFTALQSWKTGTNTPRSLWAAPKTRRVWFRGDVAGVTGRSSSKSQAPRLCARSREAAILTGSQPLPHLVGPVGKPPRSRPRARPRGLERRIQTPVLPGGRAAPQDAAPAPARAGQESRSRSIAP